MVPLPCFSGLLGAWCTHLVQSQFPLTNTQAYGNVRQGVASMTGIEDRWQSAHNYLDRMNVSAQAIPFVYDLGGTEGLIEVVIRDFLYRSRWQVCLPVI